MDKDEFVKLVADMREAQKKYFRTRLKSALQQSKELENKVDGIIQGCLAKEEKNPYSKDLFC